MQVATARRRSSPEQQVAFKARSLPRLNTIVIDGLPGNISSDKIKSEFTVYNKNLTNAILALDHIYARFVYINSERIWLSGDRLYCKQHSGNAFNAAPMDEVPHTHKLYLFQSVRKPLRG